MITDEILAMARAIIADAEKGNETVKDGFVKFTTKELSQMPKKDKKYFTIEGHVVRYRERTDKNCHSIELNYRRDGYNIWASGTTKEEAKKKFIEKLHVIDAGGEIAKVPTNFKEFTMYYFETFRKRKVSPATYKTDLSRLNLYVFPIFGSISVRQVNAAMCQKILDDLDDQGKGKTKDEIHSLLNMTFRSAVAHNLIKSNPIAICFNKKHETEHGHALTKAEEKKLLDESKDTSYHLTFAVALYTGLRPNEFNSAKIDGDFIVAVNSKQKDGKVHYKKIPISPMLRPYLEGVTNLHLMSPHHSRIMIRKYLPDHILYDLRTTFYTRCQELGVSEVARNLFVGHSLKGLANTYTDVSDEYLIEEGSKLNY